MSPLPLDAAGRRPAFFQQDGVDQLVAMVLELATEVMVVKERLFTLEAVAAARGLDLTADIETYTPGPEAAARLDKMRRDLTSNLFRTLNREHRSIGPGTADPEPLP